MVLISPKANADFLQYITGSIVKTVYISKYPKHGNNAHKTSFAFDVLEEANILLIGKPQNLKLIKIIQNKNNTNGFKSTNRFLNKIADMIRNKPEAIATKNIMGFVERVATNLKI